MSLSLQMLCAYYNNYSFTPVDQADGNMRLFAILIYVGIAAAAATCRTTQPRTTWWCPATDCDKSGSASGHTRIDCMWDHGGLAGHGKYVKRPSDGRCLDR